ncbi:MAG: polysaccharide deacetylase family protein [Cyanosarcina radialis HA8281-LM2]|nr:polysaccharide deacetylase family protein [Cyanosarcina radialis HA8281-LM2]
MNKLLARLIVLARSRKFWLASTSFFLLLVIATLFFQPRWLLRTVSTIAPGVTYFAETDRPIIALTIDDGPDPVTTPKILAILSRYRSRATFFLISSRVSGNEKLVSQMVSAGHEIGNHLTQNEPSIELSPAAFEASLLEADAILSQFSSLRWLRPGGGWYNSTMVATARKHDYRVALGSIFPYDTNISSADFAAQFILSNARPGAIVVLHDYGDRGDRTAATLEAILPKLQSRGYQIVTLSELLPENTSSIEPTRN